MKSPGWRPGDIPLLGETALKDRFQQFRHLARELLTDFREVEHNFNALDRRVRERIALWEGARGPLLDEIMGERDVIAGSDQGKSFHAFWDFLMSQSRQEELSRLLDQVLELPPIIEMKPEPRLRRVHYDWLEAGNKTQRTVAKLSEQLRRFLDTQAWLENRRIMEILRTIETHALGIRDILPAGEFIAIDETSPSLDLPLERTLFHPPIRPLITTLAVDGGEIQIDTSPLYNQIVVDPTELRRTIDRELQGRGQISLGEVVSLHPLRNGLAELVAYLQVAAEWRRTVVDEGNLERVQWRTSDGMDRQATLPRILLIGEAE